jgi:hypothetical protein
MMRFFSERFGLAPKRAAIQIDSMDDALRVGLWNALLTHHFAFVIRGDGYGAVSHYPLEELQETCRALWLHYFKKPLDTLPKTWEKIYDILRPYFFEAGWNEVYDFVEFIPKSFPRDDVNEAFYRDANSVLEREMSAYRFVGGGIVRVTDESEIEAIESATDLPRKFHVVGEHLRQALALLSERKSPDCRNSIKEAISAVEAMCALITGQQRSDLNAALRALEARVGLHGALKSAFNSLYGFTSDSNGIRHALLEEADLTFDDAKFMLVTCSAFVNYLKSLMARAGMTK